MCNQRDEAEEDVVIRMKEVLRVRAKIRSYLNLIDNHHEFVHLMVLGRIHNAGLKLARTMASHNSDSKVVAIIDDLLSLNIEERRVVVRAIPPPLGG